MANKYKLCKDCEHFRMDKLTCEDGRFHEYCNLIKRNRFPSYHCYNYDTIVEDYANAKEVTNNTKRNNSYADAMYHISKIAFSDWDEEDEDMLNDPSNMSAFLY